MKKWFIPLLACWPLWAATQVQVKRRSRARSPPGCRLRQTLTCSEISDFAVLDKEERMEGVYLVRVSYRLHFKQG